MSATAPPRTGNAERHRKPDARVWHGSPCGTAAPPEPYASWVDYLQDDLLAYRGQLDAERDELATVARAGLRALALAPTLEIYQALMRGEAVPVELLNPVAVMRYGVRA